MKDTHSTPSVYQAAIWGKVSKPSIHLGKDDESTSTHSPQHGEGTAKWIGKRKRIEVDPQQEPLLSPSGLLCIKKPRIAVDVDPIRFSSTCGHDENLSSSREPAFINTVSCPTTEQRLSPSCPGIGPAAQTLVTLHKFFLKAFSLHFAHNGIRAPAEIRRLLDTVTKLWRKRSVTEKDVQKMLAVSELSAHATIKGQMVAHSSGPFKLVTAGPITKIDYCGKPKSVGGPISELFDEGQLHQAFEAHLYALDSAWTQKKHRHLSFMDDDNLDNFPMLIREIGRQTEAHRAKSSQQRIEILGLSHASRLTNTASQFSFSDSVGRGNPATPAVVENRRRSLLERIKEKQLTNRAQCESTQEPLRKHCVDRIEEVVEILRMVQQQRRRKSGNQSDIVGSFLGKGAQRSRETKVSFSPSFLSRNIKDSVKVPISSEEVNMCIRMLSDELEGGWVTWLKGTGSTATGFVVLEGEGISGKQAHRKLVGKQT